MYVVAVGDPFNGITLYGPFDGREAAFEWAEETFPASYSLVRLNAPSLEWP